MTWKGKSVVVFSPHADDETLGMGGTIAKIDLEGGQCHVVHCTEQGTVREGEMREAVAALGARYWPLDHRPWDGVLDRSMKDLITAMDMALAMIRPDEVYLPYPSPHQDHRAVYEAGVAACRVSLGREHHWVPNLFVYGEAVAELDLYPTGLRWSMFVDIQGEPLERKLEAIRKHDSQVGELPLPSNEEYLASEAVQAGGSVMMVAAERFSVLRMSR